MSSRLSRISLWILGAAIALQLIMPFVYPIVGHDAPVHLNWLSQFPTLFREGNLYPRWMPDSFWGFGSPAFYFYPPLAYWCAGLISFICPSPVAIYQMLGLLATITSVATCYWYLRFLTKDKHSSLIGALVYGIFPYRFLDLYLRNAIGEHLAFVFFPLIFLGIEIAIRSTGKKQSLLSVIVSCIGWAGILLTNIPAAIISAYAAALYCLITSWRNRKFNFIIPLFIGVLIGVMISSVYLLPIESYTSAIKLSHLWDLQNQAGNSGYVLIDVLHWNYKYFCITAIMAFVSGIWVLFRFSRQTRNGQWNNTSLIFSIFLLIAVILQVPYLLSPLWITLPFFKFIQFSYRWDMLIVFASAVFITLYFSGNEKIRILWFIGVSSAILLIVAIGYFNTMNGWHVHADLPLGHIDAPEYLPSEANNNFDTAKYELKKREMDPLIQIDDSAHLHIFSVKADMIRFSIDKSDHPIPIIFHRAYFPSWKLRMNNSIEIQLSADSIGRIKAILPSSAEYTLSVEESQVEKIGKIISIAGLSLFGIVLLLTIFLRNPKGS